MKLNTRSLWYVMVAVMGIAMSPISHAADNVAINFTGTIKASTCNITSGAGQTISLGDASMTDFGNTGDVSPANPFSIVMNCPPGGPDQATLTFSETAASSPDLLALDTGGATGVAVRINESNGSLIKLGMPSAVTTLVSGAYTLSYQAQYQSLVDSLELTAGVANATAQFTINYP